MSSLRLIGCAVTALAFTLALSGCGGRAPRPVTVTQSFDTDMSCAQLATEIEANKVRINSLHKEDADRHGRNAAMATAGVLLIGVGALFLIDDGEAQEKEIQAYTARNNHLTQEAANDGCTQEEMAAAVAANSAYAAAGIATPDAGSTQVAVAPATKNAQAQAQFDAWYATNKEALVRAVSNVVRDEDLLAACAAQSRPTDPVSIVDTTVTGRDSSGFRVNIAYVKQSQNGTCDGQREDAFLVRIENDQIAEVSYLGPGTAPSTAAAAKPAAGAAATSAPSGQAGPAWAGEWHGEVEIRDGEVTMAVIDGAVTVHVAYVGRVHETTGRLDDRGHYATSVPIVAAVGTATADVEGTFPTFTVKFFSGANHDPDRSMTLAFVQATGTSAQAATAEMVAAQSTFDAWYAGNRNELQQKLTQEVRDEALLRSCAAHTRPNHPVDIVDATVVAEQASGLVVAISYIKIGDNSTCDESRTDTFVVRIENDALVDVTYVGAS